jgi:hypothetical protein
MRGQTLDLASRPLHHRLEVDHELLVDGLSAARNASREAAQAPYRIRSMARCRCVSVAIAGRVPAAGVS